MQKNYLSNSVRSRLMCHEFLFKNLSRKITDSKRPIILTFIKSLTNFFLTIFNDSFNVSIYVLCCNFRFTFLENFILSLHFKLLIERITNKLKEKSQIS